MRFLWITRLDRDPNINTFDPESNSAYSGYDNGIKIAELVVTAGNGSLDVGGANKGNGSTFLTLEFVDNPLFYGIWFDENGNDLVQTYAGMSLLIGFVDTTQTDLESDPDFDINNIDDTVTEYTFNSAGNGGLEIAVVPEPGTMALLGLGLLGIAGITRKRYMKK